MRDFRWCCGEVNNGDRRVGGAKAARPSPRANPTAEISYGCRRRSREIRTAARAVAGSRDLRSIVSSGLCMPFPVTPNPSAPFTTAAIKLKSPKPPAEGSAISSGPRPRSRLTASMIRRTSTFRSITGQGGTRSSKLSCAEVLGRFAAAISRILLFACSRSVSLRNLRSPFTVAALATTLNLPADVPELCWASYATSVPPRNRPGLIVIEE